MTEPSIDERPLTAAREHPPFRMRDRRRLLLPDLTPPTLEELRWARRQRRLRRAATIPQPRGSTHAPVTVGQDGDVPATPAATLDGDRLLTETPACAPRVIEIPDVAPADVGKQADTVVLPDVEPAVEPAVETAREVGQVAVLPEVAAPPAAQAPAVPVLQPEVLPEPEPVLPPGDSAAAAPLVSQVLVVREVVPPDPGRIAVLDEPPADVTTVTRIVPLPVEPSGPHPLAASGQVVAGLPQIEDVGQIEPELAGRAAPLYWRLLRLRYTRPNGWLRALFFEGAVAVAVVLVLAEAASVWTIVVLPIVVAVVVKANDVLAGSLRRTYRQPQQR